MSQICLREELCRFHIFLQSLKWFRDGWFFTWRIVRTFKKWSATIPTKVGRWKNIFWRFSPPNWEIMSWNYEIQNIRLFGSTFRSDRITTTFRPDIFFLIFCSVMFGNVSKDAANRSYNMFNVNHSKQNVFS